MQEVRPDIREVKKRWLSHHGPLEEDRCVVIEAAGKRFLVCARCLGVSVGLMVGIVLGWLLVPTLSIVLVLPLPAFVDWTLYMVGVSKGRNLIRVLTGTLLGLGHAAFMFALVYCELAQLFGIAVLYLGWYAGILLARRIRTRIRYGW